MNKITKSEQEWQDQLSPEQYAVLRQGATEPAFTGKYYDNQESGVYKCAACGQQLFSSKTKFNSGTGWPSFTDPMNLEHVELRDDSSFGMQRTEVICKRCGSHLGHLFNDGPPEHGGKRYCINSCALNFDKTDKPV